MVNLSASDNYEAADKEWLYAGIYRGDRGCFDNYFTNVCESLGIKTGDYKQPQNYCICSHWIVDSYYVRRKSDNMFAVIGSCCAGKFSSTFKKRTCGMCGVVHRNIRDNYCNGCRFIRRERDKRDAEQIRRLRRDISMERNEGRNERRNERRYAVAHAKRLEDERHQAITDEILRNMDWPSNDDNDETPESGKDEERNEIARKLKIERNEKRFIELERRCKIERKKEIEDRHKRRDAMKAEAVRTIINRARLRSDDEETPESGKDEIEPPSQDRPSPQDRLSRVEDCQAMARRPMRWD